MNTSNMNLSFSKQVLYLEPFQVTSSILSFFGTCTNTINIFVFLNKKLKDPSYKYTLSLAVINYLHLWSGVFRMFIGCGPLCANYRATIYGQIYLLAIDEYFTNALSFYAALTEIFLTLQTLLLIMNKPVLHAIPAKYVVGAFGIISAVIYIPILLIKSINKITALDGTDTYSLVVNEFGKTPFGKAIPTVLSLIRIFLAIVVLFSLNVFTVFTFKNYLRKKNILTKGRFKKG